MSEFFIRIYSGTNGNDTFNGVFSTNPGFDLAGMIPVDSPGGTRINALGGNDWVAGTGGHDVIDGGAGADTLFGGAGPDTLTGGAGLDWLSGGGDNDTFFESGDFSTDAASFIDGGEGFDTLVVSGGIRLISTELTSVERLQVFASATVTISPQNFETFQVFELSTSMSLGTLTEFRSAPGIGATYDFSTKEFVAIGPVFPVARFRGMAGEETVIGTDGADILHGDAGANLLRGGGGNDSLTGSGTLRGEDGNDELRDFGVSNDLLEGGLGADTLFAEGGADTLSGGDGNDSLVGGGIGADLIEGGAGNDTIRASNAAGDTLRGGDGDDLLDDMGMLGAGTVLDGGAGNDTLDASSDTLFGASITSIETLRVGGNVTLGPNELAAFARLDLTASTILVAAVTGTYDFSAKQFDNANKIFFQIGFFGGGAVVIGAAGDDRLEGAGAADTLIGGAGADTLLGQGGNDRLEGGAGIDVARYFLAAVNYTITRLGDGNVRVSSASEQNDTLIGVERLRFSDGFVDIAPNAPETAGNDNITGGILADFIAGRAGDDTLAGAGGADTLNGGAGNDVLIGDDGNDSLRGNIGDDLLRGGQGNDRLLGEDGQDTLEGGFGNDLLQGLGGNDTLRGEEGRDTLAGGEGNDLLEGGLGVDRLTGGAGNDLLRGGEDGDQLLGEAGDDTLVGGLGLDFLTGGAGADSFLFGAPGEGSDRIRDFDPTQDLIALSAAGFGLAPGAFDPARFESNVTGQASLTTDGVLVYMTTSGRLFWDADGIGGVARVEIALLTGAPTLTAADVVVIA